MMKKSTLTLAVVALVALSAGQVMVSIDTNRLLRTIEFNQKVIACSKHGPTRIKPWFKPVMDCRAMRKEMTQ